MQQRRMRPWRPRPARLLSLAAVFMIALVQVVWPMRAFLASPPHAAGQHERGRSSRRTWLVGGATLLGLGSSRARASAGGEIVVLKNGLSFPKASFGLQIYDDATAEELTQTAISVGYRNFFASVLAGNQEGFARGVRKSGIPREELFICGSVVSNSAQGFENAYQATKSGCESNLKAFDAGGIKYVDMIMLDYPAGDCDSIRGQWKAFEEMLASGATRSLAVSNFSPEQLDCILSDPSATAPVVNQLPYSVRSHEPGVVEENGKRGVLVQAWSPLGSGRLSYSAYKACEEIGRAYGKTGVQVALRWIVQSGATFTTQSKSKEHFSEDLDIFDFSLSDADMQRIGAISGSLEGQLSSGLELSIPVLGAAAAGWTLSTLSRAAGKAMPRT